MSIDGIKDYFKNNLDYGFNLNTTIVLVPVVSIIIRNLQVKHLCEKISNEGQKPTAVIGLGSSKDKKITQIYKWHAIGGLAQAITCTVLSVLSSPLFVIPTIYGIYQFYSSSMGYLGDHTYIKVSLVNKDLEFSR